MDRLLPQLLAEVDQQVQLAEEGAELLGGEPVHIEQIQNPLKDSVFRVPHEVGLRDSVQWRGGLVCLRGLPAQLGDGPQGYVATITSANAATRWRTPAGACARLLVQFV